MIYYVRVLYMYKFTLAYSGSHSHGLSLSLPKQAERFPPSSTNQIRINFKSLISIKQFLRCRWFNAQSQWIYEDWKPFRENFQMKWKITYAGTRIVIGIQAQLSLSLYIDRFVPLATCTERIYENQWLWCEQGTTYQAHRVSGWFCVCMCVDWSSKKISYTHSTTKRWKRKLEFSIRQTRCSHTKRSLATVYTIEYMLHFFLISFILFSCPLLPFSLSLALSLCSNTYASIETGLVSYLLSFNVCFFRFLFLLVFSLFSTTTNRTSFRFTASKCW